MELSAGDPARYNILFVTDANFLDDSMEAGGQRELLRALVERGWPCEVLCRFLVAQEEETEPGLWLAEHLRESDSLLHAGDAVEVPPAAQDDSVLRLTSQGIAVTVFHGSSTKPHVLDDAERVAFLHLVEAALDRRRPDLVISHGEGCRADVLAAAQARHIATVALQSDCTARDAAPWRDADAVLAPTRFAADYLREALGLPCVSLPPVLAPKGIPTEHPGAGAVVFDDFSPGHDLAVFTQIANELNRLRPDIRFVLLGDVSPHSSPGGGTVSCLPYSAQERMWRSVRVLLAPQVGWEYMPWSVLSALVHGVPALASNRGALPEILDGGGLSLSLPDRLTMAHATPLTPAELVPWVETIVRLHDDRAFAAQQRDLALRAGQRYTVEEVLPHYARFFAGLIERRRGVRPAGSGSVPSGRTSAAAISRLTEMYPWPRDRPRDADPGREPGWLGGGTELLLTRMLSSATRLVVELGAWLGLSTRFIAGRAPTATIVSVDHWQGSAEHKNQESFRRLLPQLYETFLARCWDYRERIVPLRMDTLEGLRTVAELGLQPDFIYVDAEHSLEAVTAELTLARQLFPHAALGGDDYNWQGVRAAVDGFARRHGLVVDRFGARGWRLLENDAVGAANQPPPGRGQSVVLVPHLNGIEWECEQGLRELERAGVRVVRRGGCSAIDMARNEMASDALHDEAEALFFIDSDIGFDPQDVLRLFARPEGVVAGIYAKKGVRGLASTFVEDVKEVLFGPEAAGLYPLKYAAAGFLRIRAGVLRRMIAELNLPLCNTQWGRGVWPFFQPLIVGRRPGTMHYLGEDWAFSHRLGHIGVTPLADTSIRLWHWGRHGFGWEEAGSTVPRYRSYNYRLE